jgi:hypothetical protein
MLRSSSHAAGTQGVENLETDPEDQDALVEEIDIQESASIADRRTCALHAAPTAASVSHRGQARKADLRTPTCHFGAQQAVTTGHQRRIARHNAVSRARPGVTPCDVTTLFRRVA